MLIAQADKKAADAGPDFKAPTQKVMDGWATLDGKNAAAPEECVSTELLITSPA